MAYAKDMIRYWRQQAAVLMDASRDDGTSQEQRDLSIGYAKGLRQGGLCKGGKTKNVRASTMRALEKRGLVALKPKAPKQPFWLRRYEFTGESNGDKIIAAVQEKYAATT